MQPDPAEIAAKLTPAQKRAHQGDPCFYCNTPHEAVPVGPCESRRRHPWGHPNRLGLLHRLAGMPRLNPEFFREPADQLLYIQGYDGRAVLEAQGDG